MAQPGLIFSALGRLAFRPFDALVNRIAVYNLRRIRLPASPVYRPFPRSIGLAEVGEGILDGKLIAGGREVSVNSPHPWDLPVTNKPFLMALNGFEWLDDLAALGNRQARVKAQTWMFTWLDRYGRGQGVGWAPQLAGRRLMRLINHSRFLMRALPSEERARIMQAMGTHITFIETRLQTAPRGIARFEALAGLIYGCLALGGMDSQLTFARKMLGRECDATFDDDGALANRNPEELLACLTQLVWTARTLEEAGKHADPRHTDAIERIAPTVRALRMGDGTLARFHGGGRSLEGRLDMVLAETGVRGMSDAPAPMGYARLTGGRTTLIMDCARPPRGAQSTQAHASTLAFEMSVGRRSLIVNCGPGQKVSPDWARASRATVSQSTLALDRVSSSKLWKEGLVTRAFGQILIETPSHVTLDRARDVTGSWLNATHDGYQTSHGIVHERRVFVASTGAAVYGEDRLSRPTPEKRAAKRKMEGARIGTPARVHFHLHPDVQAKHLAREDLIALVLPGGDTWVFRATGGEISLENSQYFNTIGLKPTPTRQIVVSAQFDEHSEGVSWSLQRSTVEATAFRDLAIDEPALV